MARVSASAPDPDRLIREVIYELTDAAMAEVSTLGDLVRAVEHAPKRRPPGATINRWTSN